MFNIRGILKRFALVDNTIYDNNSFSSHDFLNREKYRPNYCQLTDALVELLNFDDVLDVGCANGFLLEYLHAKGKAVKGIELSSAAADVLPSYLVEHVKIADATKIDPPGKFDLVCCIEVAEHIENYCSEKLVDFLCNCAKKYVYFTAAAPFQPGHGHINCQQQFFWMNLFRKRDFVIDWDLTEALIQMISPMNPAEWIPLNSLVFQKASR